MCGTTLLSFSHPLEDERTAPIALPFDSCVISPLCGEQGKHLSVLTNLNQGQPGAAALLGNTFPFEGLSIHLPLGQPWTGL